MKRIGLAILLVTLVASALAGELESTNAVSASAVMALTNRVNGRIYGEIRNEGSTPIYWGYTSNVTTSTGTILLQYDVAVFGRQTWDPWDGQVWLISAGSSTAKSKDRW